MWLGRNSVCALNQINLYSMENICQELGIPWKQIKETRKLNRFIVIVHKSWLRCLVQDNKLAKFPIHPGFDEWPNNERSIGKDWSLVYFTVITSALIFSCLSSFSLILFCQSFCFRSTKSSRIK